MPTTKLRTIDSTFLAWMAEGAHGEQEKTLYIVEEDNGDFVLTDKDPRPRKEPKFEVVTRGERPPLKKAHKIAVQVKAGGAERNLLNDKEFPRCDALFWTASSIEKFMFPYYHAQRLYSQQAICELMKKYREEENLVAAVHVAPSRSGSITRLDTAGFLIGTRDDLEFVGFKDFLSL